MGKKYVTIGQYLVPFVTIDSGVMLTQDAIDKWIAENPAEYQKLLRDMENFAKRSVKQVLSMSYTVEKK